MPINTKKMDDKDRKPIDTQEISLIDAEVVEKSPAIDEAAIETTIRHYALLHAAVALVLGFSAGIPLTLLTGAMIAKIGQQCGKVGSVTKDTTKFIMHCVGLVIGVNIANCILGLLPIVGNVSNAISSFVTTIIIGEAARACFTRRTLTVADWEKIINKIFLFDHMDATDKENFAKQLVILFGDDANQSKVAQNEIQQILKRYGDKILNSYAPNKLTAADWEKIINKIFLFDHMDATDKKNFAEQLVILFGNDANQSKAAQNEIQQIGKKILDRYAPKWLSKLWMKLLQTNDTANFSEETLMAMCESEEFQKLSDSDRKTFAINMQVLVGNYRPNEKKQALTNLQTLLKSYGIEF